MEPSKQTSNTVRLGSGQSLRPPVLGGVISGQKPAVTPDGSRVFVACGNLAVGYSTRTCRRLGALGPLRGSVTATAGGLPGNTGADSSQAIATGSSYGELIIWDAKSLQRLSSLQFAQPVLHITWPSKHTMVVFLGQRGEAASAEVIHVDSLESMRKLRETPLRVTNAGPAAATEDSMALVDGKDLVVWSDGWSDSQRYTHSHALTSVAIDPARRYVCVGDCKGVLWTWWGILDKEGIDATVAVPARWHWHANDSLLALEHCGPALLSAGREGVVCIRNMEDETVHFIPRFPTALRHMTASEDGQVVCSLEDNSLAVMPSIHGWVRPQYIYSVDLPDHAFASRRPKKRKRVDQSQEPALANVPAARSRILHNLAGCRIAISSGRRAQFLLPGETQPSKATKLSRGGSANSDPKQRWALQQLVFSADASCIMTCETRLSPALENFDPYSAFSCILKWWRRTDTDQYVLDSVSNNPHAAEVTVAIANPDQRYMFATASQDGNYKLWDRLPVEEALPGSQQEGAEPLHCWQCLAIGSWQRRPIQSGCFSPDGSMLAMGSTGSIVLWAAAEGAELEILDLEKASDKPLQLCSAVADGIFMLIACVAGQGKDEILCWDLESLEVLARLDLGAALPGRGRCEMRCALRAGSPIDVLAFRAGEAAMMSWRLETQSSGASPSPKKKRKSSESSPSKKAHLEEARELNVAFAEKASATLPQQHAVLDATFRTRDDGESSVLCWTSTHELWDIDLAGTGASAEKENAATQPEEEPLPRNAGPLGSITSGRAAVEPSRPGFVLPRRTTAAQQAGLVPRLVQRVVPPHVPSHLMPSPAVLWAGFLSVFVKPPDASQSAAPFGIKAAEGRPPEKEAEDQPAGAVLQEEFVDAAFMDALVAASKS